MTKYEKGIPEGMSKDEVRFSTVWQIVQQFKNVYQHKNAKNLGFSSFAVYQESKGISVCKGIRLKTNTEQPQ